jgi:hypothetical protein
MRFGLNHMPLVQGVLEAGDLQIDGHVYFRAYKI